MQKLEGELDAWVNDPDMVLALGTTKYKQGVMERNERLKTAKRELAELDNTLPADARVVKIDGQPWVYEVWGEDVERDANWCGRSSRRSSWRRPTRSVGAGSRSRSACSWSGSGKRSEAPAARRPSTSVRMRG